MNKLLIVSAFLIMNTVTTAAAMAQKSSIKRIEPLSWWVGMKTDLQLMLYGEDLSGYSASFEQEGLRVVDVNNGDSPNYLFVDVEISSDAAEGDYTLVLEREGSDRLTYNYPIAHRRDGSAQRESFGSQDMIYLLMPDRFANGDSSNDSASDTSEKLDRDNLHGRHGGDIQGIINRLDYLEELGVTALWSTPLLLDDEPTYSYHGYACADYYKIDPRYGSNELYRQMVKSGHERGIKTIMDVVTNHCGLAHTWIDDLPFNDWVHPERATNGNFTTLVDVNSSAYDRDECSNGWFDKPMPDLAIENPYLLQYFKQVFIWWIEYANLDGLRVDTYPYNDLNAMAEWTAGVRREYPNINIVGECWTSSPAMVAYWDGMTPNRDGYSTNLTSVMDFPLQEAIAWGLSNRNPSWGEGVMKIYNSLAHDFLYDDPRKLMVFLDNHDTDRFTDVVKGDTALVKLGVTMLSTMRGVPQFYYGTEFMLRSKDLSQGHGGARVDFPGGWRGDKHNLFVKSGRNRSQQSLFDFTKNLFQWRKSAEVIHSGATMHFLPKDNCYIYFRYNDQKSVMIIINASDEPYSVDWHRYSEMTDRYSKNGVDVISQSDVIVGEELVVGVKSSMVIEF